MLQRLLSYIVPVIIFKKRSTISKSIEVTWNNGKLVMDSLNTNYSYGSLQKILRRGLHHIGFENIRQMQDVLLLGVAGGSVIKTIVEEIKFKGSLIGVEIDSQMIEVANTYFQLDQVPNAQIIVEDAFEYVIKNSKKYDLVVIDVFQDSTMPNFLFEKFFTDKVVQNLRPKGFILFNTMTLKAEQDKRNEKYCENFDSSRFLVTKIPKVAYHNELIVIQKK